MKILELIRSSPLYAPDKKIVLYRGTTNGESLKLLFIGEAPGKQENKKGKPFVGPSGKLLDKWIASAGLEKKFGVINAVPLIPLNENGGIRPPTEAELKYFKPLLLASIRTCNPELIVCLGGSALKAINPYRALGSSRGQLFRVEGIKAPITVMYHPSYYLRNGRDGLDDFNRLIVPLLGG